MNQDEVLNLIEKKDGKAYTHLYNMYAKSLFAVISNLIKNREEAEDVLQDVFVKIWSNIDSYNPEKGRLYTWMLNITRNTTIDKMRSKGYNRSLQNQNIDNFVSIIDSENKFMNKIDIIGVGEFIKKLKPKCIQIIDLLFFKGYTQAETSEELAMPLGSVKTLNRTCINDLRTYLQV